MRPSSRSILLPERLSFINAPDFEAPSDVGPNNVYNVTVQVSDGALTDSQAIAVTVTNVSGNIVGNGNDNILIGTSEEDTISGLGGNDLLRGGLGKDTLDGGSGSSDTADYSDKTAAVVVTLNGSTNATVTVGGLAEDTIKNLENIIGGSAADTLIGDLLANILNGGGGADLMRGMGGNDTYVVDNAGDVVDEGVVGSGGTDTVLSSITFSLGDAIHAKGNIENLTLTGATTSMPPAMASPMSLPATAATTL